MEMQNQLRDVEDELQKGQNEISGLKADLKEKDTLVEDLKSQLSALQVRSADEKLEIVTRYEDQAKSGEQDPDLL